MSTRPGWPPLGQACPGRPRRSLGQVRLGIPPKGALGIREPFSAECVEQLGECPELVSAGRGWDEHDGPDARLTPGLDAVAHFGHAAEERHVAEPPIGYQRRNAIVFTS